MNVQYTAEIIHVDEQARVMEIVYRSTGRQTMHVSARLPYIGESLESVVDMYSPVNYWREQELQTQSVTPGLKLTVGQEAPVELTLSEIKMRKLNEIANARFLYETRGILINGIRIKTDRESQSTISGAYSSLKDGLIPHIDWKAEGGDWVRLTLAELTPIAQAVANHVQSSFTLEKQLAERVMAATNAEQVEEIVWPL